ncbi:glutathione S-transferase [Shewanella sp. Isolate11]|uniref:glutathione S-transferase n=1 Tax=Shewanella sp. Isolate11 TaxID=2908530 RepID=UPI001EFC3E33|nr:glutathione S-transferase [Shewanella sp. Isolate11]MCG9696476.1 glutathione S-transferase [Shewanella sp. Isolate11]
MSHPTLYSFRRCPYAMRARLGLLAAHQIVMLREIVLKHKPEPMLQASPKGTVPVLILASGQVIDESLDIILWALRNNDPQDLLLKNSPTQQQAAMALIKHNDLQFKPWLDKYKYADRHPQHSEDYYRQQGEQFIDMLEQALSKQANLMGSKLSIADIGIFPFIRQFAHVNLAWWQSAPYPNVQAWLERQLNSELFINIMKKYPTWLASGDEFVFASKGNSDQ